MYYNKLNIGDFYYATYVIFIIPKKNIIIHIIDF